MATTHSFVIRVTDSLGVVDDQTITVSLADKPANESFIFRLARKLSKRSKNVLR